MRLLVARCSYLTQFRSEPAVPQHPLCGRFTPFTGLIPPPPTGVSLPLLPQISPLSSIQESTSTLRRFPPRSPGCMDPSLPPISAFARLNSPRTAKVPLSLETRPSSLAVDSLLVKTRALCDSTSPLSNAMQLIHSDSFQLPPPIYPFRKTSVLFVSLPHSDSPWLQLTLTSMVYQHLV